MEEINHLGRGSKPQPRVHPCRRRLNRDHEAAFQKENCAGATDWSHREDHGDAGHARTWCNSKCDGWTFRSHVQNQRLHH